MGVMTETVDRAIETARAQRGARPAQARQESVSVRALLGKIDFLTRSLSKERPELRFSVDENVPESIETDGTLVWRILMNYVTNALKAAVRPGAEQGRGVGPHPRYSDINTSPLLGTGPHGSLQGIRNIIHQDPPDQRPVRFDGLGHVLIHPM